MTGPLHGLRGEERKLLNRAAMPAWTAPMLATLHDELFSSPEWIYERKLDGERGLVFGRGSSVSLMSRNQMHLNGVYPELVDALQVQTRRRSIVDGEVVAFDGNRTTFSRLQQRVGVRTGMSPTLVAEVAFTEWTTDGRLRHPRFIGLRDDKPTRQVVRAEPA